MSKSNQAACGSYTAGMRWKRVRCSSAFSSQKTEAQVALLVWSTRPPLSKSQVPIPAGEKVFIRNLVKVQHHFRSTCRVDVVQGCKHLLLVPQPDPHCAERPVQTQRKERHEGFCTFLGSSSHKFADGASEETPYEGEDLISVTNRRQGVKITSALMCTGGWAG